MCKKYNSLSKWLRYLEKFKTNYIYNLNHLKIVAKKLNILSFESFIFTVAGTNGKGTTCAMLETLFLNQGYTVGLYTSPHLISYLERVRINGNILDEYDHISAFQDVEKARKSIFLSYFEFITLSALILFKRNILDIIILEVGIGGRLDATNIIDSNLSIITSIGIDHSFLLGSDRYSIAKEKSGIFRAEKIAVIGEINIPDSINQVAKKNNTILKKNKIDWFWNKKGNTWNIFYSNMFIHHLPIPKIPLLSAAIALSSLYYAGFKTNIRIIKKSLLQVKVVGRFQILSYLPYIIIDVAHNPDASVYLSKKIKNLKIYGKIHAIIGVLKDKDICGIIKPLKNQVNYWYAAPLKSEKTATLQELKMYLPQKNTFLMKNIQDSWNAVRQAINQKDLVLVFGSFITVSEFLQIQY